MCGQNYEFQGPSYKGVEKQLWHVLGLGKACNASSRGINILASSMTTGGHRFRVALYFSSKKKKKNLAGLEIHFPSSL